MRNVIITISVIFCSSCSILFNNDGSSGSTYDPVYDGPSITINTTNEITLPLSPQQAENAYQQAISWMNATAHVPHDDNNPGMYYVQIFLTNSEQYYNLLKSYILYSPLPYVELETNQDLKGAQPKTGVVMANGYTNVFPVYALITSYHYNLFLDNKFFIFRNIRQVSNNELAALNYNTNYIAQYDERMLALGITPPSDGKSKGFFDGFLQFCRAVVQVVSNIIAIIINGITGFFSGGWCNVNGYINYSYYDNGLNRDIRGIIPNVWVKCCLGVGDNSSKVSSSGYYSIILTKKATYKISVEMAADYAWLADKNDKIFPNIFPVVFYVGDYTVPDQSSFQLNISLNNSYGISLGNIYKSYEFAKTSGLLDGIISTIKIKFRSTNNAVGGVYNDYESTCPALWGDPSISIINESYNNIYIITHEYGHFLHYALIKKMQGNWVYYDPVSSGGPIVYPDGSVDEYYYKANFSLLTEAFAEFYASAFCLSKFPVEAANMNQIRILENNFGSKEILYRSAISNSNSIGKTGSYYLYQFDFPRFYKEASILFDLWDINQTPRILDCYNISGANIYSTAYVTNAQYWSTEFTNTSYLVANFSPAAIITREKLLDRTCVSLKNILITVSTGSTTETSSPFYLEGDFITRIQNSANLLGVSQSEINDLLRLHSFNTYNFSELPVITNTGTTWVLKNSNASFGPRCGFGALAFNGKLFVIGGIQSNKDMNDVWTSTDGSNWTCVNSNAPFSGRYNFGCEVFNGKIWVLGNTDAWYSDDGISWYCATSNAFGKRAYYATAVHDNKLWIMAGVTFDNNETAILCSEVWNTSDGTNWQLISSNNFAPRNSCKAISFKNNIWLMGGDGNTEICYSGNGRTWTYVISPYTFPPRMNYNMTLYDGMLYVIGGINITNGENITNLNDIWVSPDGTNWICKTYNAEFNIRSEFALINQGNTMWILGGYNSLQLITYADVWKYE